MNLLDADFFARDTLTVARDLLGCRIELDGVAGTIVETEAYTDDAASHAVMTRNRGRLMWETWGKLYIYKIYGMHHCLNFTTDANGPGAVLIRALEPLSGLDRMRERRGNDLPTHRLTDGPGKLCRALGIDATLNGGKIGENLRVFAPVAPPSVAVSTRIGITKAVDLPWRFYVPNNPCVSRHPTLGRG